MLYEHRKIFYKVFNSLKAQTTTAVFIPGVEDNDPDLVGSQSVWLPLGSVSAMALLVTEDERFSLLVVHSSVWSTVWFLWFCWPPWGHIVGAVEQIFGVQLSVVLSGSFLTICVPMWFTELEVGGGSVGATLGWVLHCSSACLLGTDELLQSTGPLALGGGDSSSKGPFTPLHFWQEVSLHLQVPTFSCVGLKLVLPCWSSVVLQGFKQGSLGEVLPKETWGLTSSAIANDLALTFCSVSSDDLSDSFEKAFCLIDRCRIMLHWRAMTFCSHCLRQKDKIVWWEFYICRVSI